MTDSDSHWVTKQLAKLLSPRVRLTVSQWADAYRQLSAKSSSEPGPWRTERTPYLREIMDALSLDSPVSRVVVMKSAQMGAPLAVDTPIPTPNGWSNMGDLQVGDRVFDDRGRVVLVDGVSPIFHDHVCFRVVFSDGESIVSDAAHLWTVDDCLSSIGAQRTLTTAQMAGNEREGNRNLHFKVGKRNRYAIRIPDALDLPAEELPIQPYTFGVWLGDGNSASNQVTTHKDDADEMAGYMTAEGHYTTVRKPDKYGRSRDPIIDTPVVYSKLKALDVLGKKRIPTLYLRASATQRLALLQGLMDTDGFIDERSGRCELTVSCSNLAADCIELLRSLGYKPTTFILGRAVKVRKWYTRISFMAYADQPVVRLRRKAARLVAQSGRRTSETFRRRIVAIEPVDSVPTRCISVTSESHLFLAGRGMIATHNTEAAGNWIGYIMGHVRTSKPTLIVVPTDRLLVRWVHQRLRPMIEGAADLANLLAVSKSRDGTNRIDMVDYPGGILYLTTAGSAANLKSDSICYVICDEADEYEWDVGGRGDPLGLIESRQSNFPRRKLLIFSTPTVKGTSRIEGEWNTSDQRRYHVQCPTCGEMQTLEWEHLHWKTDLSQVWYTCAVNGCTIEERDKTAMLAQGVWIAAHPDRRTRGYHLSALYAPLGLGYSWTELATQWDRCADNDELKQTFINERLGLPYEDRRTNVMWSDIAHRAEPYPLRQLPPGALLLTAGVDTQDDRLAVQIVAWGETGRWWVIDWVELPGDPARPEVWQALHQLLARPIMTAAGTLATIEATAIDMAGHHTEAVKGFVRASTLPRIMAIQGSRHRLNTILSKPRPTDYSPRGTTLKYGMKFYQVGTELCKDRVYGDLRADTDHPPADRRAHFSQDLPPEFYAGLLSEAWNPKKNRYEPKRGMTKRNEPLDTFCYALAAAHHPELRLDRLRAVDWKSRANRLWPAGAVQAVQDAVPEMPVAPIPPLPNPAPRIPPPPQVRPSRTGSNFVGGWKR